MAVGTSTQGDGTDPEASGFAGSAVEENERQKFGGEESTNRRFPLDKALVDVTDAIVAEMRARRAPDAPRSTGDVLRTGLITYAAGITAEADQLDPDAAEPKIPQVAIDGLKAAAQAPGDGLLLYYVARLNERGMTFA